MSSKRSRKYESLTLNEILEELECLDEDERFPTSITILPPQNANADVTDEDSGDEQYVALHNLPGSQLRSAAEYVYSDIENELDSDDDMPLSELAKRRRTTDTLPIEESEESPEPTPGTSSHEDPRSHEPVFTPSVPSDQRYRWRNIHNPLPLPLWQNVEGPKNLQSPLYYFECMFDETCISLLVTYTNVYANNKNKPGNVTPDQMKCFIGILLFSGYVVVPRRAMYWEHASDSEFNLIRNAMSRDKFNFIMANIHCCHNAEIQSSDDKFAKLRPMFDLLNKNFLEYAPIEEHYSIDEAMVPYYGRHSCKQFIREKPIRWGYKFWVGATRLGYITWFEPYQGKGSRIPDSYKRFGLGGSVVLQCADALQTRFPQVSFHVYFDNFFSSIPLFHELANRGLKATGTIRENRTSRCPLPPAKEMKKTERGTYQAKSSQPADILVCKWNDNSVVTVASNSEKVEPTHSAKRFSQQHKKYVQINQPDVIKKYNENMGGVDRADQNIGLYRTSIRGKKWYFSLLCHCLDMALHNAWQLYKSSGGENDHLTFRRVVARSLLESYKNTEGRGRFAARRNFRETSRYDRKDHLVDYQEKQNRCMVCKTKTSFFCNKCTVYLHPKKCFVAYHTPV